jgi:hypothetical protein
MTVCISAKSSDADEAKGFIVSVTDTKLSNDWRSSDEAVYKVRGVGLHWRAMFSASRDLTSLGPIMSHVENELRQGQAETLEAIQSAFSDAYAKHLNTVATDRVLAPYKLSIEEYRQVGLSQFGPAEFARINSKLESISIDLQFLVYGFTPDGLPHHFKVNSPDATELIEDWDFQERCAIGAGQYLAEIAGDTAPSCEYLKKISPHLPEYAVTLACFAKFTSESAPSVGKETWVSVLFPDGYEAAVQPPTVAKLRNLWDKQRDHAIEKFVNEIEADLKAAPLVRVVDGKLQTRDWIREVD